MSRIRAVLARTSGRVLTILAAMLVAGAVAAPLAAGSGEGKDVRGGARNPAGGFTKTYHSETEIIASNGTFGTRQSNKGAGGGAIYGCRARNGNEGCVEASNLSDGQAFNFRFGGQVGGTINTDAKNKSTAKPFTTNATGVATGLNADRVDGKSSDDIVAAATAHTKAAVVGGNGALSRPRGITASTRVEEGHYRVTFDAPITTCVPQATAFANGGTTGANATVGDVSGQSNQLDVYTATSDNNPADRQVSVTVTC